jgi:tetratricopeptide (TPR) repeat protein
MSSKVVLCEIVGNESQIIERNLAAAAPAVDGICICANGKDETAELIEKFGAARRIPTKVEHHEWKNFGHNRTLSFQALRRFVEEQGWKPSETYGLLLDADMILEIKPGFDKAKLCHDHYFLQQDDGAMIYDNVRLVRCDLKWRSCPRTHEYWSAEGQGPDRRLDTLLIRDVGDGGCKADKAARDIRFLLEDLAEDPKNARCLFYLAQTYKQSGQPGKAIEYYEKRIEAGGWAEETWYSRWMLGECHEALGNPDKAALCYLKAFEDRPQRAESLWTLARMYREGGRNVLAFHFADAASRIPFPEGDALFVYKSVYSHLLLQEKSIAGFYAPGAFAAGFRATDELLQRADVPQDIKDLARSNIAHYIKRAQSTIICQLALVPPPEGAGATCVAFIDELSCLVAAPGGLFVFNLAPAGQGQPVTFQAIKRTQVADAPSGIERLSVFRCEGRPHCCCHCEAAHEKRIVVGALLLERPQGPVGRRDDARFRLAEQLELACPGGSDALWLLPPPPSEPLAREALAFLSSDGRRLLTPGPSGRLAEAPPRFQLGKLVLCSDWLPKAASRARDTPEGLPKTAAGARPHVAIVQDTSVDGFRFLTADLEAGDVSLSLPFSVPDFPKEARASGSCAFQVRNISAGPGVELPFIFSAQRPRDEKISQWLMLPRNE